MDQHHLHISRCDYVVASAPGIPSLADDLIEINGFSSFISELCPILSDAGGNFNKPYSLAISRIFFLPPLYCKANSFANKIVIAFNENGETCSELSPRRWHRIMYQIICISNLKVTLRAIWKSSGARDSIKSMSSITMRFRRFASNKCSFSLSLNNRSRLEGVVTSTPQLFNNLILVSLKLRKPKDPTIIGASSLRLHSKRWQRPVTSSTCFAEATRTMATVSGDFSLRRFLEAIKSIVCDFSDAIVGGVDFNLDCVLQIFASGVNEFVDAFIASSKASLADIKVFQRLV
uniref:Uncharacterized protein n=1 Tax=Glossina austeni TaxID=7395 RepID=A0A1A9VQW8_GLOAU